MVEATETVDAGLVCPVCGGPRPKHRRTCSDECGRKRSAQASAEAAKQMRERNGPIYEHWKKRCQEAAKAMAESA